MEASSGKFLGNYYGDEGYSSLDLVTLSALLSEKLGSGDLRIVTLNWSNYDEIEVHIESNAGTVIPAGQPETVSTEARIAVDLEGDGLPFEEGSPGDETASPDDKIGKKGKKEKEGASVLAAPRYLIYDRRTVQPLGEYFPDGVRPRIDRLTLHRMLPGYDFRTFQIDSIRWHEGEVRIFIKGERKKNPEASLRQTSGDKSMVGRNRKVRNTEETPGMQDRKPRKPGRAIDK